MCALRFFLALGALTFAFSFPARLTQEGKHVMLRVDDSGVKFALSRLTKSFLVRTFAPDEIAYETGSQI